MARPAGPRSPYLRLRISRRILYRLPSAPAEIGSPNARPLVKQLPRFSAADVPALGPEEEAIAALVASTPPPTGLPDKGASQRPMLYIGEGYNKMYLINHGKIQWTYATGGGNEYDDVWALSNGNVIFTPDVLQSPRSRHRSRSCGDMTLLGDPRFTPASPSVSTRSCS